MGRDFMKRNEDVKIKNKRFIRKNLGIIILLGIIALGALTFYIAIPAVQWTIAWFEERERVRIAIESLENFQDENFQENRANLTREDFAHDIEQLMIELEQFFPSFWIIYERYGVDMHEIANELINYILYEAQEMNWEVFYELLQDRFFAAAEGIGGFRTLTSTQRLDWLMQYTRLGWTETHLFADHIMSALASHASNAMYEPASITPRTNDSFDRRRNFKASSLQSGQIAYLEMQTISTAINGNEIGYLRRFHRDISDYNHLIIDIRGLAGDGINFLVHIFGPLIRSNVSIHFSHYFMPTSESLATMQRLSIPYHLRVREGRHDEEFIRDQQRLSDWDLFFGVLVGIEEDDFFYELGFRTRADGTYRSIIGQPQSRFNGTVWLLIDEETTAAAKWAAEVFKYIELGIIVGETTKGSSLHQWEHPVHSRMSKIFALPHSGIIVQYNTAFTVFGDGNTRPLEFGVKPHYFNREGMDALETVLAMIAEMDLNE